MIVKIEDLQVSDEFITPSNNELRWFKLIRPIKHNKSRPHRWATARCSTKINQIVSGTKYDYKTKTTSPRIIKKYGCSNVHNAEVYVDLNYKSIWLISRNGQKI